MTQDSTGAAVVDRNYHWQRITDKTPRGQKLQLIHRPSGTAQYGVLQSGDVWYTHYKELPTFAEDDDV